MRRRPRRQGGLRRLADRPSRVCYRRRFLVICCSTTLSTDTGKRATWKASNLEKQSTPSGFSATAWYCQSCRKGKRACYTDRCNRTCYRAGSPCEHTPAMMVGEAYRAFGLQPSPNYIAACTVLHDALIESGPYVRPTKPVGSMRDMAYRGNFVRIRKDGTKRGRLVKEHYDKLQHMREASVARPPTRAERS
eukprot:scaffold79991_cov45-Phaeocystis_antarctica.AAC.1